MKFRYVRGDKVGKKAMEGEMEEILREIVSMNGGWGAIQALHYYLDNDVAIIEIVKRRGSVWYEYEVIRSD